MNKIAILYVEAEGDFEMYPINLFAGREDQMEEVCKRLNEHLMEDCPDILLKHYLDEALQDKIVDRMQMNALLGKANAQKLIDTILQYADGCTIYASQGVFGITAVEVLQGGF